VQEAHLTQGRRRQRQGRTGLAQKRVRAQPVRMRQTWTAPGEAVGVTRQCVLAARYAVPRSMLSNSPSGSRRKRPAA
jgi:hypothetical protein